MSPTTIPVAILGARAYTASALVRCLLRHPGVRIACLQARVEDAEQMSDTFGEFRGVDLPPVTPFDPEAIPQGVQAVFLCLPHTASGTHAPGLLDRGMRVLDLSADFRFGDYHRYEEVYGVEHPCPALAERAVYGLPELNRERIMDAHLTACPGCYPTSTILSLAPALRAGLVEATGLVADCKSGVSGAGRTPTDTVHYCNANEGIQAYKAGAHRHGPEIEEQLGRAAGTGVALTFVPHLAPMDRGILASCYGRLAPGATAQDLQQAYADTYGGEPCVRLFPPSGPLPRTKDVTATNYADVAVRVDEHNRQFMAFTAIDNLVKGASGQAVQCFNLQFGFSETLGLLL